MFSRRPWSLPRILLVHFHSPSASFRFSKSPRRSLPPHLLPPHPQDGRCRRSGLAWPIQPAEPQRFRRKLNQPRRPRGRPRGSLPWPSVSRCATGRRIRKSLRSGRGLPKDWHRQLREGKKRKKRRREGGSRNGFTEKGGEVKGKILFCESRVNSEVK